MTESWRYTLLSVCFLAGCANIPDSYAPPVQRKPLTGTEPATVGNFVSLGDRGAGAFIVRDVSDGSESGMWRWTRKRPELQFYLGAVENLNLTVDFTIPEVTFRDTGPVKITVLINGNLLDTIHCREPGERHFNKPAPPKFLRANAVNFIVLEIDKVWVAKDDGAVLGFILTRAGFTQ